MDNPKLVARDQEYVMHIPVLGKNEQVLNIFIRLGKVHIVLIAHQEREEDLWLHLLGLLLTLFRDFRDFHTFFVRFLRILTALAASGNIKH